MSKQKPLKVVFASDLHGSLGATQRIIDIFEEQQADWLVLLGDLLNHGPRNPLPQDYDPAAVARLLNKYARVIIAVQGNCDSEVDQMLLQFPLLTAWQNLVMNRTRFFLTHGHTYSPDKLPPLNTNDVLVYGHTHIPQLNMIEGICCFNPGSTTLPKKGHVASYGLMVDNCIGIYPLAADDRQAPLVSMTLSIK